MEDWFGALASELKLDERDLELFLRKRRAKWQRRRDPNYRAAPVCVYLPVDVSLMEEGERAYQEMVEEREKLFKFREEHRKTLLEAELKQRRKELESFQARLTQKKSVQQWKKQEAEHWSLPAQDFIKDLEATCVQMEALAEIRKMKHTMTPKTPALHNRLLSGNIYNQSLGLFNNSLLLLETSGDESQSEYSHLHLIGQEVSISQEESEGIAPHVVPDMYDAVDQSSGGYHDLDSDTPGVGMEVICTGGLDKDTENTLSAEGRRLLQGIRADFRFPKQPVTSMLSPPSTVPKLPKRKRGRPRKSLEDVSASPRGSSKSPGPVGSARRKPKKVEVSKIMSDSSSPHTSRPARKKVEATGGSASTGKLARTPRAELEKKLRDSTPVRVTRSSTHSPKSGPGLPSSSPSKVPDE